MIQSETALQWLTRKKDPTIFLNTGHEGIDQQLPEGTIPINSVTEIAGDSGVGKIENEEGLLLLERVYIERVYTPGDMINTFDRIDEDLLKISYVPLVVINSIGAILSDTPFMDNYNKTQVSIEGSLVVEQVLKRMRDFCSLSGGTIITLNHLVHWRGYPCPALGNTWIKASIISARIILERSEDGILTARVQKRNERNQIKIQYEVNQGGFCAVSK
ncbi:RAD51-like protein 1 [Ditylenchus destructor]|uniref:RAD51-like protein 1 n=1 Tax=Ditylenchus destructor TaxID=166010 RepID=A0AAD4NLS3_9BILA|nr:RAD51-like protein 1 [Ditylenchus destructor]